MQQPPLIGTRPVLRVFANQVEWTNDQGTGGDAGFSNLTTLLVDDVGNVTPVNGLVSIGPVNTATITTSTIKGGLEADPVRDLTVTVNMFTEATTYLC